GAAASGNGGLEPLEPFQPLEPLELLELLDRDRPLERLVRIAIVIVIPARAGDDEIPRLLALARAEKTDLVDFGAVGVFGMRVAVHLVGLRVFVQERPLTAGGDGDALGAAAGRRDRVCVRGRPAAVPAASAPAGIVSTASRGRRRRTRAAARPGE